MQKLKIKMQNYNSKFKIFIPIAIFVLAFFVMSQGVMAEDEYGLETTATQANLPAVGVDKVGEGSTSNISSFVGKIVGAGLAFVGVLFFILMIYGGILWMTARGNDQQVTKAKDLIIAAVIGLIIVLSAYAITAYIGGAITS